MEVSFRRRINISTSVKGIITWDCTVESENASQEELLKESNKLVAELKALYPIEKEK